MKARSRRRRASHRRAAAVLLAAVLTAAFTLHGARATGAPVHAHAETRAVHHGPAAPAATRAPAMADFEDESASPEARRVADWALRSGDHGGMPYVVVDKVDARAFVFDARGHLLGAGPTLLGMQRGDGTAAGIGGKAISAIAPGDRTTPAGRFVASLAPDLQGRQILWVDYDSSLALHRVAKGTSAERRAERLHSASPDDNRISYGCINVAVPFFERVVIPAFTHSSGVVYILPETRPAAEVFGLDDDAPASDARP